MPKYAGAVRRSLAATPCEGEAAEGGEPHVWRESDTEHGRELERPPSDARQAVGVAQVESWRRNIYASKLHAITIQGFYLLFSLLVAASGHGG